ncbi:alpha-ketoglutarate-dependent dioxygenase AlkB [Sphingomonas sp. ID1715]|uniref:alpha-ketoglutarate-dependent dioxygenase AlkB n=1 Tax=Sphingomonas sp. ID1715 TaxID=1656898 RepID=UPI0014883319|nr:alpha-ketoglutarate-dependent dioxygenase AlkB [Sphingomonas sp. ID1715]NNM77418.1 alpha-ketoglutarate-dependent dioxygenase AlkB [Sphingomonas sp. ID1715]
MPDDLFGPAIPGLAIAPDLVGRDEERQLIQAIDAAPLEPFRFQGWTGKRLTASYGWRYDFDDRKFAETEPLPAWLLPVRDRAAAVAGLAPHELPHALLIRYDPDAGIGWHRDRPVFEQVVGISLGAADTMRFRRRAGTRFERHMLTLEPRSAYLLSGPARWEWEHSITPADRTRWSITFRSLRR